MEQYNLHALWGLPIGALFIINGLWKSSPFIIPYFRKFLIEQLGEDGYKLRMVIPGALIMIISILNFFKIVAF